MVRNVVLVLGILLALGAETEGRRGEGKGMMKIQWGWDAHRVTAAISEKFMSPLAFDRFMAITSNQTLVDVCVWADQARGWFLSLSTPFLLPPFLPSNPLNSWFLIFAFLILSPSPAYKNPPS